MMVDKFVQLVCVLMQENYDDAASLENMFQQHFALSKIEDVYQLVKDLAEEGDWPKRDDGEVYAPDELIEKVIKDNDFFNNMGLLIIISRIWKRLEKANVLPTA